MGQLLRDRRLPLLLPARCRCPAGWLPLQTLELLAPQALPQALRSLQHQCPCLPRALATRHLARSSSRASRPQPADRPRPVMAPARQPVQARAHRLELLPEKVKVRTVLAVSQRRRGLVQSIQARRLGQGVVQDLARRPAQVRRRELVQQPDPVGRLAKELRTPQSQIRAGARHRRLHHQEAQLLARKASTSTMRRCSAHSLEKQAGRPTGNRICPRPCRRAWPTTRCCELLAFANNPLKCADCAPSAVFRWNDAPDRISRWDATAQAAIDRGDKVLFSFNEPIDSFCPGNPTGHQEQACMKPE